MLWNVAKWYSYPVILLLDKVIPSINARKFDPKAKVTLVSFWLSTYQVSKKNLHDKGVRNPS